MKKRIAIIGASGFIGSNLLKYVLDKHHVYSQFTVILRSRKHRIRSRRVKIVYCDHLDATKLKTALSESETIFDTAGLAWQHSVGNFSKIDLLIEEILQNAVSAYVIGEVLQQNQTLVWTSTSAIDTFLSQFSQIDQKLIGFVTKKFAQTLCTNISIEKDTKKEMRQKIRELLLQFPLVYYPKIINFSYAYSKLLGQIILESKTVGNIRILKISDVYGQGQDVSKRTVDETLPARRIQRFVAAYRLIKTSKTNWIPKEPKSLHGFFKTKEGSIVHEAWDDFLSPTYIEDVVSMIIQAGELQNTNKTVFEVYGNRISNIKLIKIIQNTLGIYIKIKTNKNHQTKIKNESSDLRRLGFSKKSLISFEEGSGRWLKINK